MKNQNRRDLERQWSDQAKKAARKMSGGKQPKVSRRLAVELQPEPADRSEERKPTMRSASYL